LPGPSPITLSLYDMAGELVYQTTLQGGLGENVITWNLENLEGQQVASGLYLYQLNIAQGYSGTQPHGEIAVLR
jgi:hypothetical protein